MPPKYNYAGKFVGPMTLIFGNEKYYVEHIERSFEYSTLDNTTKTVLDIRAWRYMNDPTPLLLTPDYSVKRVLCNGLATIVLWADGTKTVVKLAEGDKNDRRVALLYAFAKRKFGSNSRIHKEIDRFAKSNAQRIALLNYIVAKDGVDIDKVMENLVLM